MGLTREQAVAALYRAPFESFVAERKRLAAELKAEGDKLGAAELAKRGRPSISAWAVNQLWWHARATFDELFESAAELRKGRLSASPAHRQALAKLGARAQQLLTDAGHSANDATLRRITMTLSGLAAVGSFEPDAPGTLSRDRDPPGFEAFGIATTIDENEELGSAEPVVAEPVRAGSHARAGKAAERRDQEQAAAAAHEAKLEAAERKRKAELEAAERKRKADEEIERRARRKKLETDVRDAKAELAERERERDRIQKQLAAAEREVERAQASLEAAQAALAED